MRYVGSCLLGSVLALAILAALGARSTVAGAATGCASPESEARRAEQNTAYLPDCRAYELVTPPGGAAQQQGVFTEGGRSAVEGGALTWFSYYPPPGFAGAGLHFLSRRRASGWSTEAVIPPLSTGSTGGFECSATVYFSEDLLQGVLQDGRQAIGPAQGNKESCGRNEPSLIAVPQASALEGRGLQVEPEGFQNLFLHDTAGSLYQPINLTPTSVVGADAWLQGASADFSHVVFSEEAKLSAGAPGGKPLYEWADGAVHLVSVRPDGTPVAGEIVDDTDESLGASEYDGPGAYRHSVSHDGTRVIFEDGGDLFVRINADQDAEVRDAADASQCGAKACTIQIDASQASGPGGGGQFFTGTEDGSTIFFTDGEAAKLTSDTEAGSGQNLYAFEVDTGKLTDLTSRQPQASVLGLVGFGEESGIYHLYFAAEGVLASEPNVDGEQPQAGKANL
jgi:hypothetical protein